MKKVFCCLPIFVAMILSACATVTERTDRQRIEIAADAFLVLPDATELTESFNAAQVIVAEYEDDTVSFEGHIEARPGSITVVGLTSIGGALFSIRYDGTEIVATGAKEAQVINAEYVLADVLLTHWDVEWLDARLSGASIAAAGSGRTVTRGGTPVIDITFGSADPWGGTATLTHVERNYVLTITTAEFSRP